MKIQPLPKPEYGEDLEVIGDGAPTSYTVELSETPGGNPCCKIISYYNIKFTMPRIGEEYSYNYAIKITSTMELMTNKISAKHNIKIKDRKELNGKYTVTDQAIQFYFVDQSLWDALDQTNSPHLNYYKCPTVIDYINDRINSDGSHNTWSYWAYYAFGYKNMNFYSPLVKCFYSINEDMRNQGSVDEEGYVNIGDMNLLNATDIIEYYGVSAPGYISPYQTIYDGAEVWSQRMANGVYKIYDGTELYNILNDICIRVYITLPEKPNTLSYGVRSFSITPKYSDCIRRMGVPVLEITNILPSVSSVSFTLNTNYPEFSQFYPNYAGRFTIYEQTQNGVQKVKDINGKQCFVSISKLSNTVYQFNDLELLEDVTYYIAADGIDYRWSNYGNNRIEMIDFDSGFLSALNNSSDDCRTSGFPRLYPHNTPFVSSDNTKAVSAYAFSIDPTPVARIERAKEQTDYDIPENENDLYDVYVNISPDNWSRTGQSFMLESSDTNIVTLPEQIVTYKNREETKFQFLAKNAGTATITMNPTYMNQNSQELTFTVNIHSPVKKCEDISSTIYAGERTIINLLNISYQTPNGSITTDKMLSVKSASSNHIEASIISDTEVSIIGLEYGSTKRSERVVIAIGDYYDGIGKEHCSLTINLTVLPIPPMESLPTNGVGTTLTFTSIETIQKNLVAFLHRLNNLSDNRWDTINSLSKKVDVSSGYKLSFVELTKQLNNLEENIYQLLTPIATFLEEKDDQYLYAYPVEKSICEAISILYPDYRLTPWEDIDVPSFMSTLVGTNDGDITRHEFVKQRYDWCNKMIESFN